MTGLTPQDLTSMTDVASRVTALIASATLPGPTPVIGFHSLAGRELQAARSESPLLHATVVRAHNLMPMFLVATHDFVSAIADLASESTVLSAPATLSRAAVEAGAKCTWLADASVSARLRATRLLLLEASSASGLSEAVAELPAVEAPEHGDHSLEKVRLEAEALGIGALVTSSRRPPTIGNETLPGSTRLARLVLAPIANQAAFHIDSGVAHSEVYGLLQSWAVIEDEPVVIQRRRLDRIAVWAAFSTAIMASVAALQAMSELFGWGARAVQVTHFLTDLRVQLRALGLPVDD